MPKGSPPFHCRTCPYDSNARVDDNRRMPHLAIPGAAGEHEPRLAGNAGINMVNARPDGATWHGDRRLTVAGSALPEGTTAGQPHSAKPEAVDPQVPQLPATRGARRCRR